VAKLNEAYPGAYAEMVKQAQRHYDAALENFQNATLRYEQAQITNTNAVEDAQRDLQTAQNALAGALAKPNTAQVSIAEAELAVKQAQATQTQAEWESLQNGPPALEVSKAEARVENAEATLASAQAALAQLEIKAPFAGVILEVNASAGQTASAAHALFTLADPQAVEAETTVIEEDVPYVQVSQLAEVYFDALPSETITGTVARVVPQRVDGDRPLYHVYLTLSQVPAALFEGMSADASIVIEQRAGALCLPRALAQASADGTAIVEVWANGQKEKRTLTIGLRGDTYVEVLSGLVEGEAVVAK
jgi:RND family efflux transporter MFP subunit